MKIVDKKGFCKEKATLRQPCFNKNISIKTIAANKRRCFDINSIHTYVKMTCFVWYNCSIVCKIVLDIKNYVTSNIFFAKFLIEIMPLLKFNKKN